MPKTIFNVRPHSLLLGVFVGVVLCGSPARADELLVGTARVDLTPSQRVPLAGYSRRRGRLATGVHDPLSARALVVREGNTTVALVSCDLLIIDEVVFRAIEDRLRTALTSPPSTLLIAATHTHSGPGAYGKKFFEKLSMGHFDEEMLAFVTSRVTQAIVSAASDLQPVTVRYGTTRTEGLVINRMDADGTVDPELNLVMFDDPSGTPVSIIASFAAHPTTLGAWNHQLGADYPGVFTKVLEARYPSATCLFAAGAVGDQGPVKQGSGFEAAERLGHAVATEALTILESASRSSGDGLVASQRVVRLPPAQVRLGSWTLPAWLGRSLVDDDATLTLIAVGSVLLIGVPCDLSAELGLELKRYARVKEFQPIIVGFANDYIGYCMPPSIYTTDHYEAAMMFNGPTTGALIVNELKHMIDQIVTSDK